VVPLHMGVECGPQWASDMEHEFSNECRAATTRWGFYLDLAALVIQRRRQRLVLDANSLDSIDRAAIFVPEPQRAEAA
jgi:hypothetical protein